MTKGKSLIPDSNRVEQAHEVISSEGQGVSDTIKITNGKSWLVFLSLALLMGAMLRLSFPGDIEYKGDEKYTFETAQKIGVTESWPSLGMISGVGAKNPGMSVWIFAVLSKITHASTPPELARAVQLLNILGLVVLAFFSFYILPEPERITWCWATAFAAVNPIAVLFHRKIWAQSTLPLFCVLLWIAWHYRHKRAGAFFWGLVGICLGQIHLPGFFLAAGVFLWTAFYDRRVRWGSWLLGSLVGVIPMIPWLQYMLAKHGNGIIGINPWWILCPSYWFYWVTDSLGVALKYSLKTNHFLDFLSYPLIGGKGTYLVAVLHVVIIMTGILMLVSVKKTGGFLRGIRDVSETGLAINSVLLASGILMTLSCFEVCRHYLIMTFPMEWVWLSRMGLRDPRLGQRYLMAIWIAQLFISASFLVYIHIHHGDPAGNYGMTYQFQSQ